MGRCGARPTPSVVLRTTPPPCRRQGGGVFALNFQRLSGGGKVPALFAWLRSIPSSDLAAFGQEGVGTHDDLGVDIVHETFVLVGIGQA